MRHLHTGKWTRRMAAVMAGALVGASAMLQPNTVLAGAFSVRSVSLNGTILSKPYALVASDGSNETTYMPIWYIGQALTEAGFSQSWNGQTHTWNLSTSATANFSGIGVGAGSADILVNGKLVKRINTHIERDPAAGSDGQATVYMPIYYVQQILRAAGISASWNGRTWSISTSQTSGLGPKRPIVLGFVTDYGGNMASLQDYERNAELNQINTFTDSITRDGGVAGTPFTQALDYAHSHNQAAYISVTDTHGVTGRFDAKTATAVLTNSVRTKNLVQNLVTLVKGTAFAGVNIDFEMLPPSDRTAFSQFLADLSRRLHAIGKKLTVDAPAVSNANSAYDYTVMGAQSDNVILMAYDYSYPGGPAGPIAPIGWVRRVLSYAVSTIPSNKIILGVPSYGYDWVGRQTTALTLSKVDTLLSTYHIQPSWDAKDEVPYFTYNRNGVKHTVYYENAQSTSDELSLVSQYHIAGIAIWRIGLENGKFWKAVERFVSPRG